MSKQHYPDINYLANIALWSGDKIVKGFNGGMVKHVIKKDNTPLTKTDSAINTRVIKRFDKDFPHVLVVGEEERNKGKKGAEYMILCDPIDGTIPFCRGMAGVSTFCISLLRNGDPISAVIYDPFNGRLWKGEKDKKTTVTYIPTGKTKVAKVSKNRTFKRMGVCILSWREAEKNFHLAEAQVQLIKRGVMCMNPVSVALFGGLIACGQFEASIFPGLDAWETAAMQIIVKGAGGEITDLLGNTLKYDDTAKIKGHIISNGLVHNKILKIVHSCQR